VPQRLHRPSVTVGALLFALSLVAAFAAGFARGEGAGGSLPVAAASVHATTGAGSVPHGGSGDRAAATHAIAQPPAVDPADPDRAGETPAHPDHAVAAPLGTIRPPMTPLVGRHGPGRDVPAGHGPRPPPARGPPASSGI